jgi:hypothetical protein
MHYSWCTVRKADQLTVYFKVQDVQVLDRPRFFRRCLIQVKTSMSELLKVVYHTMTELTGTTD